MLKLIAEHPEAAEAVMPLRWCVTPDTLAELKNRGAINAHLLLVVIHDDDEVDRHLVPLGQMMDYVEFQRKGKHTVFGTIVWHEEGNVFYLRKMLAAGNFDSPFNTGRLQDYETREVVERLLPRELDAGEPLYTDYHIRHLDLTALHVVVPAEFFAKEPPEWEKRWVNLWFETKPRDQCQFRRRRFAAYTIQPPLVLFWLVARTLFQVIAGTFLVLAGMRRVDFRALTHPWTYSVDDLWSDVEKGNSVFLRERSGKRRALLWWAFTPLAWLIVFAGAMAGNLITATGIPWWLLAVAAPLALIVPAAVITVGFWLLVVAFGGAVSLYGRIFRRETSDERERRVAEERRRREEAARLAFEREHARYLAAIACDGPVAVNLKALPKQYRTVHLRFLDLKARVCRPFALR